MIGRLLIGVRSVIGGVEFVASGVGDVTLGFGGWPGVRAIVGVVAGKVSVAIVVHRLLDVEILTGQRVDQHSRPLTDGVLNGKESEEKDQKYDDLEDDEFDVDRP